MCQFDGDVALHKANWFSAARFDGGRVDGELKCGGVKFGKQIVVQKVFFTSPSFSFPSANLPISLENCFVSANARTVEIVKAAISDEWDPNVATIIAEFRGREAHDGN